MNTAERAERVEVIMTMRRQIGNVNIAAISGGRAYADLGRLTLWLPVGYGYKVEVEYDRGSDLYTVRRIFARGGRRWVKGEVSWVDASSVGEVAYRASCYHDAFGGVSA